ncbi:MAG TPA: nucleotidyltransferase domain-containing protein [Lachnospiraceae bacterium]|nr:nucleotidyltransferase domain-containing protein [Lachnospiraceae bacterium]
MRTYEAIDKVSKMIVAEGLCEAILLKGSIGRGDDDAYSDIDMYVVVKEENMETFLDRRMKYLESYMPIVFSENVYFVAKQIVAIYEDGLHIDLYTVTEESLPHTDKAKVVYDPEGKFSNYTSEVIETEPEKIIETFSSILYEFVEADTAYCRRNYPWAARILNNGVAASAVLLRYLYDKEHAYLGLKKINEIIPQEQYSWLLGASENLNREGFQLANENLLRILDFVADNIDESIRTKLDYKFLGWIKENINKKLFNKERDNEL